MARKREGTMFLGPDGLYRVRVTEDRPDGTTWRPVYSLGTSDRAAAQRKRRRLIARLAEGSRGATEAAAAPDSVAEYAEAYFARREAQGVVMASDERILWRHAEKSLGALDLDAVRPKHIRSTLDEAVEAGRLSKESIRKLRGLLSRIFKAAWQDELIDENPVARVDVPRMREVRRERCILTDEEIATWFGCAAVPLILRMMGAVARIQGGMRTSDVNRWDWSMIDRNGFEACHVVRSKTGNPQPLMIPPMLRPHLRAWWEASGSPDSGPVFPVERGARAGEFRKERGISYAKRLRTSLWRAGIRRHELHHETETTLPVDFHSFRRAFNTALAVGGVGVQRAMRLANHADSRTHMRYVVGAPEMRTIPDESLPQLPAIVTTDDDSDSAIEESGVISARHTRFERVTFGSGGAHRSV